jgi:hypothetical protein
MAQDIKDYYRYCPDQPRILISDATCFSRRRVNYPWCAGCPFNDDEKRQREGQGNRRSNASSSGSASNATTPDSAEPPSAQPPDSPRT